MPLVRELAEMFDATIQDLKDEPTAAPRDSAPGDDASRDGEPQDDAGNAAPTEPDRDA